MKYFFGWENIKKLFTELYHTFSSNPSYLSSKRIERALLTSSAIAILFGCFIYLVYSKQLSSLDAVALSTPLFVAAGYNMSQTQKEKKEDSNVAKN